MQHALVDVAAEIQAWAAKSKHEPFREAAAGWVVAIEQQVTGDLQAVDALKRMDATGDAITEAKRALCTTMGLDEQTPMVDLLRACQATFVGFMQLDESAKGTESA